MTGFAPKSRTGDTIGRAAKARQLALDLDRRPAFAAEDFVIGPANREAFALVTAWPDWPHPIVMLHGAAASGKSHLAGIWAGRSGAAGVDAGAIGRMLPGLISAQLEGQAHLVEDIDRPGAGGRLDEDGLFHLINHAIETGGTLLVTSRLAGPRLTIDLPDLASRLRAASTAQIRQPDGDLLESLLVKLFADRQIDVDPQTVTFAVGRMERSFAAATALVQTVDRMALEQRRRITIPLLRRYFDDCQGID